MKPQLFYLPALILLLSFSYQSSFSAPGTGSVMGQVTDSLTHEPVSDANVVFDCQGNQRAFLTNEHGYYYASNLPQGVYHVSVSFMSHHSQVFVIVLGSDEQRELNIPLGTAVQIKDVVISIPIIEPLEPEKDVLRREVFTKLPVTKVQDLAQYQTGITEVNGVYYVKGAREGSLVYYIDGIPVLGVPDIPLCGLDTYTTYTGFIPPKYGNTTGGVVVMDTRNYFSELR